MCLWGEQKGPVASRHVETGLIEMQAVVRSLGGWLGRDEDKESAGNSCPSVRSLAIVTANASSRRLPSELSYLNLLANGSLIALVIVKRVKAL
jgi:hypothetical protein